MAESILFNLDFKLNSSVLQQAAKATGKLDGSMNSVESSVVNSAKGSKALATNIGKSANNGTKLDKSLKSSSFSMGSLLKQGLGFAGIMGAGAAVSSFFKLGTELESAQVQFKVLTGSAEEAKSIIAQVNDYANSTPYNNRALVQSTKLMMNFGVSANDAQKYLHMLGDVAAGDEQKLGSLSLAFAQVSSQGKLMGQDLLQMINAGFNPLKELSEQTGKSMATLKDEMSNGMISFDMVASAFERATSEGGAFNGMAAQMATTVGGKWSTIVGKVQTGMSELFVSQQAVFGSLLDKVMMIVDWTMQKLPVVAGYINSIVGFVSRYSGVITAMMSGLAAGFAIYKAWAIWQSVIAAGGLKIVATQVLMNLTNPFFLITAGLMAVAGAVVWAWNKFEGFRGVVMGVWEVMKSFGNVIKDYVINRFHDLLDGIGAIGKAIGALFKGDFSEAWQYAKKGASSLMGVETKKKLVKDAISAGKAVGSNFNKGYEKGVAMEPIKLPSLMGGASASTATGATSAGAGAMNTAVVGAESLGESAGSKTVEGATGFGGQTKSKNITISIGSMIEQLNVAAETVTEGADEIADIVLRRLLAVVNNANNIQ